MTELKTIIRESYDARPATDTLSWASIQARTPKRRRRWQLPAILAAIALVAGGFAVTGSSDPDRLPPVDFDVALAPNYDGNALAPEDEIAPNGGFVGSKLPGADFRVQAMTVCHSTPGTVEAMYTDFPDIADYRQVTEQDFIDLCIKIWYDTDFYRARILGVNPTAGDLLGGDTGLIVLPDTFTLCIEDTETSSVHVLPGFKGLTDMSRVCQNLAMHPLDFNGELRKSFVLWDSNDVDALSREWRARLERIIKPEPHYAGFKDYPKPSFDPYG